MKATQTQERRRRSRPRTLAPTKTHEDVYLSELSLMGRLGRPETFDAGLARSATHRSFTFAHTGLSGRYDVASGLVVGARLVVLPKLVTAAWGTDGWFSECFLEMVPPPDVRDVRSAADALLKVDGTDVSSFEVGDPEVVYRVGYRTLLQAAGLIGRRRS